MSKKPKKWAAKAFNPSHKGELHRALGIPLGQKIPQGTLSAAIHRGGHVGHMALAARNINKKKKK